MQVVVLSESAVDETVVRILVRALLPRDAEFVEPTIRHRGVDFLLRGGFRSLALATFYQGSADGLACVVDADMTPPHEERNARWSPQSGGLADLQACSDRCRLCYLRRQWAASGLARRPRPKGSPPLRVALGLAVPSIEAWLLAGSQFHVTEAAWRNYAASQKQSYNNLAKQRVFSDLRGIDKKAERAEQRIEAILESAGWQQLQRLFPDGFGAFVRDLQRWR
ncbi:MAG TPA: hypothetical protein EYH34_17325 [Planctomycetes bacterium]|nr:hypothetical protein [Planctomycetota bacterium]